MAATLPPSIALPHDGRTVRALTRARGAYHEHVERHVETRGGTFVDKAISAPGAAFVRQVLGRRRRTSMRVLDMGLGFSTVVIGEWMASQFDNWTMEYVGVDHDRDWLSFVVELVAHHNFGTGQHMAAHVGCRFALRPPHDHTEPDWKKGGFDVILVDHGDGQGTDLDTRAADTPWLSTMLNPDGIMLFDDWRPKHEGRIRRALGDGWQIGAAEWTRRFARDKAIGWAVRA